MRAEFQYSYDSSELASKSAVAVGKSRKIDRYSNINNHLYISNQEKISKAAIYQLKDLGVTLQFSYEITGSSNKSAVAVEYFTMSYRNWKVTRKI